MKFLNSLATFNFLGSTFFLGTNKNLKFMVSGQDLMMNYCDNCHERVCGSHGSDMQRCWFITCDVV